MKKTDLAIYYCLFLKSVTFQTRSTCNIIFLCEIFIICEGSRLSRSSGATEEACWVSGETPSGWLKQGQFLLLNLLLLFIIYCVFVTPIKTKNNQWQEFFFFFYETFVSSTSNSLTWYIYSSGTEDTFVICRVTHHGETPLSCNPPLSKHSFQQCCFQRLFKSVRRTIN